VTTHELIAQAFAEDLPGPDITTDNLKNKEKIGYAFLVAKSDLQLSGCELFEKSILFKAPEAHIKWFFKDGDRVLKTQKIASIYGNLIPVLTGERVALNFLGFLSGIATQTYSYVSAVEPSSKLTILDTRKTLPLYREWTKKAVRDGGGHNHRMNLSDAVLIKENHIRIAGSITLAVEQLRQHLNKTIAVEVTSLKEIEEALAVGAERLLLDNMSNAEIATALDTIPENVFVEASGNMTRERIAQLSQLEGLDAISVGAITHSAPQADLSLLFDF
jgi:nicotinate-nucleotide pyrophosphorylase (carboxylating)